VRLGLYVARRIAIAVPTLLGVTVICFVLVRVLPGNPAYLMAGPYASDKDVQELARSLGLAEPLPVQYGRYLRDLLRGDMGRAWFTAQAVTRDLADRFPATFELANAAFLLAVGLGVPLGVLSAVRRDSWLDHACRVVSILGVSTPLFCSGLLFILVFYAELRLAPAPMGRIDAFVPPPDPITGLFVVDSLLTGNWTALRSSLGRLALPSLTLGLSMLAPILRMVRSSMLEVLGSRYVTTAVAYGVPFRRVVVRYALANALLPILTTMAVFYGFALSGMVLVETIFSWPGLGAYAINAILNSDYAAIQGLVVFVTFLYAVLYLLVDILYAFVDPRIAY
jgi:peptide/nickel transport system permease protein